MPARITNDIVNVQSQICHWSQIQVRYLYVGQRLIEFQSFVGRLVPTYFLYFIEESDQSGHSSESDQAEDPHKHQYPHHFVGLGGIVFVVVL